MGGYLGWIVTVYMLECTLTTVNRESTNSRIFKIGSTNTNTAFPVPLFDSG
jgi:hypothetical protein